MSESYSVKEFNYINLLIITKPTLKKSKTMSKAVEEFMAKIIAKNPGEIEFHQAVKEVTESIMPFIEENPKYRYPKILERIAEPERVIIFRVPWMDDKGEIQIKQGLQNRNEQCNRTI